MWIEDIQGYFQLRNIQNLISRAVYANSFHVFGWSKQ